MRVTVEDAGLRALAGRLERADEGVFFRAAARELAERLLALVRPRTPVKTGRLLQGWSGGPALAVEKLGEAYVVTVENPVAYASQVEDGHRQTPGRFVPEIGGRLKADWVEGRHFLRLSEEELREAAPAALERRMEEFLRRELGAWD